MITILDSEGNVITTNIAKELFANLNDSNKITLMLRNTGDTLINDAGVYLVPTSFLGEIDHFVNKTPDEFLNELTLIANTNQYGLKVFYGEELEQIQFFNQSNGSTKGNKIILKETLDVNESFNIQLQFIPDPNINAEIIYVGIEAE